MQQPRTYVILVFLILGERHVTVTTAQWKGQNVGGLGSLVKKNERSIIFSTEYGDISEARLTDGNQAFQLHFITLEPNSLFLPVFLHYDMVFYVLTGSGRLSYLDEDDKEHRRLRRGDVHRLRCGSVFFIQSDLENERQKLRIIAIFDNTEYDFDEPASGPYSSISDLVRGFDETVLSAIFKESGSLIEEIRYGTRPPAIIHGLQQQKHKKKNSGMLEETVEYGFMEEMYNILDLINKNKKKSKLFNIYDKDPDFKNDNGWSTVVDKKKYAPLKGSKYGVFMVYLTEGSMMGPHWNPVATEIAVAEKGKGMVQIVCPRMMDVSRCNESSRYFVEEGDVLAIPRFHGMAQMAFDNESFVFMGFSTSTKNNYPQYLAGKASVPRTLDKHIMAASLGINVTTFDKLWDRQVKSIILNCTSCAVEEWMKLMEDIEKERQREEEKRREEEEEAQRREEEKRREEEEARKREEEEAKEREEEEERKKEEEAAEKKREVEEEALRKWAEEVRKWQEQQRREQEKQEQKRREEEEKKRQEEQQEQEEEEREKQEQQEREREEQQRREEEEEAKRKRQEQEQQQQQQEEEEERKRQEQKEWERQEQEQKQEEQEEREARQREKEQEQEQEREEQEARQREKEQAEEEAEREREEEAAKEQEQEETPEGQGQWGEDQGVQEEWTNKEREQAKSKKKTGKKQKHNGGKKSMAAEAESNRHQQNHRKNKMVSKNGQEES